MKITDALGEIGRPVVFYPSIAKIFGIEATIFISQIIYWTGRERNGDGWIYKSTSEIEAETSLTYKQQILVRRKLIKNGCLEERYDRVAHRIFFRADIDAINETYERGGQLTKGQLAPAQRSTGTCPKVKSSITESTTESTTSECEKISRSRSLEKLSEKLPNTSLGGIPTISHRPPMEIREEKVLQRRLSGMYDNTFGAIAIRVVKHFCSLYSAKYGRSYGKIVKVDMVAKNISNYIREGENEESMKRMLDSYFKSEKAGSLPVKLTTAFSDDTYRAWTQGKLTPAEEPSSESAYPMNIDGIEVFSDDQLMELYSRKLVQELPPSSGKWILTAKGRSELKGGEYA